MYRFLVSKNWVPLHGDVQDLIEGLSVLQYATHLQRGGEDLARKWTGCAAMELTMFPVTRLRNGRSLHKTATLTLHQSHQAPLSLHEAINKKKRTHFSDRMSMGKSRNVNIATVCFSSCAHLRLVCLLSICYAQV